MKTMINILLLSFALFSSLSQAQEIHFFKYHLPAPPVQGTQAFDRDFSILHDFQKNRTPEDCSAAGDESSFTLESAFGPQTGILTDLEVKKTKLLSLKVYAKVVPVVYYFKERFKRLRPYVEDSTLNPCIRKPNKSDWAYPSGHSTVGFAMAIALSRLYPAKAEAILARGYQVGENRVMGGVHHPSDVEAGRELATQLMDDEDYRD